MSPCFVQTQGLNNTECEPRVNNGHKDSGDTGGSVQVHHPKVSRSVGMSVMEGTVLCGGRGRWEPLCTLLSLFL